jgi:L-fucose isomerase-like protein
MAEKKMTFGLIVGNRGFFPNHLAKSGREEMLRVLSAGGFEVVALQKLLYFICERGFEHHIAANLSSVASAVQEATTRSLGWDMYYHGCENGAC